MKERAFNKHTDSCKQFIPIIQDTVKVDKPKVMKPMGVDDGFKGEGAACGASVVEVAHQMISNKNKTMRPLTRVETEGNLSPTSSYLRTRRNSKSLPASPLSSPITKRKNNHGNNSNRLFGLNFQSGENSLRGSDDDIDKKSGSSWILSSLFAALESTESKKKDGGKDGSGGIIVDVKNSNKMTEYNKDKLKKKPLNETTDTGVAVDSIAPTSGVSQKNSFFKSKPYLRDLNLLTPTSM